MQHAPHGWHGARVVSAPADCPMPANDEIAVLVVNEQADILDEVAELLRRRGLPVEVASGADAARHSLQQRPGIGVVVADVSLLQGAGLELAATLLAGQPGAPAAELLLIAGYEGPEAGPLLDRLGVLREPLTLRHVEQAVNQAMGRAVLRRCVPSRLLA